MQCHRALTNQQKTEENIQMRFGLPVAIYSNKMRETNLNIFTWAAVLLFKNVCSVYGT